ncbi:restriction endonuclease [Anaerosporomusa subterranea]|uniref:Restriction endonuclease n=1 Tax=Anaerosporomusa subterranea TaxID=1794912 RepID=A0A154BQJ7_ANASB|nr:Eco47II family restriction endonuclease [Anaerosporomusa subterranea]KYZ76140.1 restriction endonuclease [Anaerosporomusa subterranea]
MSYNLGFIQDEDIFNHVKETVEQYRFKINLTEFNNNIIDPIKLTFDSKVYGKSYEDIIEAECIRQIDKTNSNHIGYFHQNIFKYLGDGWEVPSQGYDVINEKKNIFVELKNKHNTMNSASSQKTYMKMQSTILKNDKATCMLVEVIAKKSQNTTWVTSLDGQQYSHERIRRVSIDKFYEIVTADTFAFKKMCEKLPLILDDVVSSIKRGKIENSVFAELNNISPNILKSLFLLSFNKYDGFDSFEVLNEEE